jgi:hypothetical protein
LAPVPGSAGQGRTGLPSGCGFPFRPRLPRRARGAGLPGVRPGRPHPRPRWRRSGGRALCGNWPGPRPWPASAEGPAARTALPGRADGTKPKAQPRQRPLPDVPTAPRRRARPRRRPLPDVPTPPSRRPSHANAPSRTCRRRQGEGPGRADDPSRAYRRHQAEGPAARTAFPWRAASQAEGAAAARPGVREPPCLPGLGGSRGEGWQPRSFGMMTGWLTLVSTRPGAPLPRWPGRACPGGPLLFPRRSAGGPPWPGRPGHGPGSARGPC